MDIPVVLEAANLLVTVLFVNGIYRKLTLMHQCYRCNTALLKRPLKKMLFYSVSMLLGSSASGND